ncbi:hypothetical protein E2C01_088856 [Portunus trituberculatus]|uniref:Uncharacterized protein n=1 Tax=Portunus trituberculatus TaxID=210409 RepID=A0A5B7JHL5_PORTR|nr:hypothetical protein [Portunus trituberculatus]
MKTESTTSQPCNPALTPTGSGGGGAAGVMGVGCGEEGGVDESLAHDSLASLQMLCRRRAPPLYPDAKQQV